MSDKPKTKWFPHKPGRWTFKVVDHRVPEKGEFFTGTDGIIYQCAEGYRGIKKKDIVVALERVD